MRRYRFRVTVDEKALPADRPAWTARLTFMNEPSGGEQIPTDLHSYDLNADEWRRLVRIALMGLGYTTVTRYKGGWFKVWKKEIEHSADVVGKTVEERFPS